MVARDRAAVMVTRAWDATVAVALGLLTAPLWAAVAIAIVVFDGSPVLHRAVRVGRSGALFTLYKFRTMRPGPGLAVTAAGDERVTRLGAFLRRKKWDEIPQLWNVVRGDMSLVGPRPEDPRYVAGYSPEQRRLLTVRPGMTSPATLAYLKEAALLAAADDPEREYVERVLPAKLALDLAWLEERSVSGDAQILAATARALLAS